MSRTLECWLLSTHHTLGEGGREGEGERGRASGHKLIHTHSLSEPHTLSSQISDSSAGACAGQYAAVIQTSQELDRVRGSFFWTAGTNILKGSCYQVVASVWEQFGVSGVSAQTTTAAASAH